MRKKVLWRQAMSSTSIGISFFRPFFPALVFLATLVCAQPAAAQFIQQGPELIGIDVLGPCVWQQSGPCPNQGTSAALSSDGDTLIIGGPYDSGGIGAAWVFVRNGAVWTQQAKLVGTGY